MIGVYVLIFTSFLIVGEGVNKLFYKKRNSRHSSLGNHFIDLPNFRELTDSSLVNPLKSSKNSHSHTANIRMLGDSIEVESLAVKVDSTNLDSIDSIKEVSNSLETNKNIKSSTLSHSKGEKGVVTKGKAFAPFPPFTTPSSPLHAFKGASHNNVDNYNNSLDSASLEDSNYSVCGTHPKEASSGERESVREGEGSDFAIQAPSPSLKNGRLEKYILLEDSKELKDSKLDSPLDSKDSTNLKDSTKTIESLVSKQDSKDSTLESKLFKDSNIESKQDSIYQSNLDFTLDSNTPLTPKASIKAKSSPLESKQTFTLKNLARLKYILTLILSIILALPFINIAGNSYSLAKLFYSLFDSPSNATILFLIFIVFRIVVRDFGVRIKPINPLVFMLYLAFGLVVLLGNFDLIPLDITHADRLLQVSFVAIFMIILFLLNSIVAFLFLIALMFNDDNLFLAIFDGYLFIFSFIFSLSFGIKALFRYCKRKILC